MDTATRKWQNVSAGPIQVKRVNEAISKLREDFRALRAAAATFGPTKDLGPEAPKDIEHRDNYSMGRGNYLSDHGWDGMGTGWVVKSYDIGNDFWHVTEDAI